MTVTGARIVQADLLHQSVRINDTVDVLKGVEDVSAYANRVTIRGDDNPNYLFANACRITMRGAGGDDVLHSTGGNDAGPSACPHRHASLYGGRGNDILQGYTGNDVLVGGPGSDKALGGRGTDHCDAESLRNCESR